MNDATPATISALLNVLGFTGQANDVAATRERGRAIADENARIQAVRETHYVGHQYDADRETKDTAALIRAELKAAAKAPGLLQGCKFKVRSGGSSMHSSISVVATPPAGFIVYSTKRIRADLFRPNTSHEFMWMSKAGCTMLGAVKAIVCAYNYDKSDTAVDYFNVGFYEDVRFDHDYTSAQYDELVSLIKAAGIE